MLTPAEIAEAQRLCEAATPGPWDYDQIMMPFYNDPEGNSCGGQGAGFWEVWANDPSEPDGDPIMLVDRTTKGNAAFIAAARDLLPKALTHLQAQAEQLRQAQAGGAELRLALVGCQLALNHTLTRGIQNLSERIGLEMADAQAKDALSSTPAITAYAARVARMEAALRHLAYWQLDLKGTVAEAQSCVQACALAALEGDG